MSTIVVSDLHIGDNRVDRNLSSLFRTIEDLAATDSHLVLNGDIFDFAFSMSFDSRHREFISIVRKYGQVTCIQGNHDWIFVGLGRAFAPKFVFCPELKLIIGGRKFQILHGHQSDLVSNSLPWLNRLLIRLNHRISSIFGIDLQMKLRGTKYGQRILEKQEDRIVKRGDWAEIVVAGHTHRPAVRQVGYRTYVNTGDWVERAHRSYLLIQNDGSFELITLED